jgi:hypothetical protein
MPLALNDDQLAAVMAAAGGLPERLTEAILRAHRFSTAQMVDLVHAGLVTAPSQRVVAGSGGRRIEVTRMRITEPGQRALA